MCSIGHHALDEMVRAPRRHTDGSVTAAVRQIPRATLNTVKANKHAQLRAEIEAGEADALAEQHGVTGEQLELIPAGAESDNYLHIPKAEPQYYWQRERD